MRILRPIAFLFPAFGLFVSLDSRADRSVDAYLRTCPTLRTSDDVSAGAEMRAHHLSLRSKEPWLPSIALRRQQSANLDGRILETSYGISGAIPAIPHWVLLKRSSDLEGRMAITEAKSIDRENLELQRNDYFKLARLRDSLAALEHAQEILGKRANANPTQFSSALLQSTVEATLLFNKIEDLKSQTQTLQLHFEGCDPSAEPKWHEPAITEGAEIPASPAMALRQESCQYETERTRNDIRARNWAWTPQVRYSYFYSFNINNPNTNNADWSLALAMQLPLFGFQKDTPRAMPCTLSNERLARQDEDKRFALTATIRSLPNLRRSLTRMKSLLPAAASQTLSGDISLRLYNDLARDFVDLVEKVATVEGLIAARTEDEG